MTETFETCGPTTCEDTPRSICSLASAVGLTRCASRDGRTTGPSGPEVAPANLSARQAEAAGLLTSGTCGHISSISSASAALADSLASRFRAQTASLGSTLYNQTWKVRATPQLRLISARRASAPRTSGSDCIGWPNPHANSTTGAGSAGRGGGLNIQTAVTLTGWPTPTSQPAGREYSDPDKAMARALGPHANDLKDFAQMAGWPTPRAEDAESTGFSSKRLAAGKTPDKLNALATHVLSGWVSPTAQDGSRGGLPARPQDTGVPLSQQAVMAGWAPPQTRDHKGSRTGETMYTDRAGRPLNEQVANLLDGWTVGCGPARRTASGEILTGSSAGMESGGQLAPSHSRWLMGLPRAWDECAPKSLPKSRKK